MSHYCFRETRNGQRSFPKRAGGLFGEKLFNMSIKSLLQVCLFSRFNQLNPHIKNKKNLFANCICELADKTRGAGGTELSWCRCMTMFSNKRQRFIQMWRDALPLLLPRWVFTGRYVNVSVLRLIFHLCGYFLITLLNEVNLQLCCVLCC